jgi:hypothetical protein
MQQIPRDWIEQRKPRGSLILDGQRIEVTLDEAEAIGERMSICRIDGDLSEPEADRIALHEHQQRKAARCSKFGISWSGSNGGSDG